VFPPRLKTITTILENLKEPHIEFAESCIPEAIMCTNAKSSRVRIAAYTVLHSVVEAMLRWRPDEKDEVFREYSVHVMKVLLEDGTERFALYALTKLYFEFRDIIPLDVVDQVLTNVFLLMRAVQREIADACMGFIKVFVVRAPLTLLAKYVPNIMLGICEMNQNNRLYTRTKTKSVLERLVRKFGSEMIHSYVLKEDESMQKRLKAVRKEGNRERNKKERARNQEAEDQDQDDTNFLPLGQRQKTMEEILASSDDEFSDSDDEGNFIGYTGILRDTTMEL